MWWDLKHYTLNVEVDIKQKRISGSNTIRYHVLTNNQLIQIDLQEPMIITSVSQDQNQLKFKRDGNAYFISLIKKQKVGHTNSLTINFEGAPKEAKNPPWDVGFIWAKDENGIDFIGQTSQEGGASSWWPCKDHMYDEPDDGMIVKITNPEHLIGVANGRLKEVFHNKHTKTKTSIWEVTNPINNYCISINIGDYISFSEKYKGEKGLLDCNYYVLSYNLEKAKKQFKQVSKTLSAFEYWFGPYPFYEDSYKLVETPYLGMENQSSIAYGNKFKNGYMGKPLGKGGLNFDYIIIHETGHEWFGNNITYKDIADMWIHEAFTCYSENLYLDYHFGKKASQEYVISQRINVKNKEPLIGTYNVNKKGADLYSKGANIIHTLRQIVNDDVKWRSILRNTNKEFYHKTVTTNQIENYLNDAIFYDLNPFFEQYLRGVRIPKLEYHLKGKKLYYKWTNTLDNFTMPVKVYVNNEILWLNPESKKKTYKAQNQIESFKIDPNFYISTQNNTSK